MLAIGGRLGEGGDQETRRVADIDIGRQARLADQRHQLAGHPPTAPWVDADHRQDSHTGGLGRRRDGAVLFGRQAGLERLRHLPTGGDRQRHQGTAAGAHPAVLR